jgi:hypothetical protein
LATIQEQQKAIINRRRTCARNCRKRLMVALAGRELTFADLQHVDLLVGAHVEAAEIMSLYLLGKAPQAKLDRLHLIRSQIMRLLGALGLAKDPILSDPEPAQPRSLETWLETWQGGQKRPSERQANESGPSAAVS